MSTTLIGDSKWRPGFRKIFPKQKLLKWMMKHFFSTLKVNKFGLIGDFRGEFLFFGFLGLATIQYRTSHNRYGIACSLFNNWGRK